MTVPASLLPGLSKSFLVQELSKVEADESEQGDRPAHSVLLGSLRGLYSYHKCKGLLLAASV